MGHLPQNNIFSLKKKEKVSLTANNVNAPKRRRLVTKSFGNSKSEVYYFAKGSLQKELLKVLDPNRSKHPQVAEQLLREAEYTFQNQNVGRLLIRQKSNFSMSELSTQGNEVFVEVERRKQYLNKIQRKNDPASVLSLSKSQDAVAKISKYFKKRNIKFRRGEQYVAARDIIEKVLNEEEAATSMLNSQEKQPMRPRTHSHKSLFLMVHKEISTESTAKPQDSQQLEVRKRAFETVEENLSPKSGLHGTGFTRASERNKDSPKSRGNSPRKAKQPALGDKRSVITGEKKLSFGTSKPFVVLNGVGTEFQQRVHNRRVRERKLQKWAKIEATAKRSKEEVLRLFQTSVKAIRGTMNLAAKEKIKANEEAACVVDRYVPGTKQLVTIDSIQGYYMGELETIQNVLVGRNTSKLYLKARDRTEDHESCQLGGLQSHPVPSDPVRR